MNNCTEVIGITVHSFAEAAASTANNDCGCGDGLLNRWVILGLIIWLVILTLIVIIVIVIVTIRRAEYVNKREAGGNLQSYQRGNPWFSDNREEHWKDYTTSKERLSDRVS